MPVSQVGNVFIPSLECSPLLGDASHLMPFPGLEGCSGRTNAYEVSKPLHLKLPLLQLS
jgi:hypothetical protein